MANKDEFKQNPFTGKPDDIGPLASNENDGRIKKEDNAKLDWHPPVTKMNRYGVVLNGTGTPGDFDEMEVGVGTAIKVSGTIYLIYNGSSGATPAARNFKVGIAESTDGGRTWTNRHKIIDPLPEYNWIFAQDIVFKDGLYYLFLCGPLTDRTDQFTTEKNPKIWYTSPDLENWTYGGVYMNTTAMGLPNYCANSAIADGGDGYYYMTNSAIADAENAIWQARIIMLRTSYANFPTGWEKEWEGQTHYVLDYDEPRWAAAGFNTFFDSKIFKIRGYWVIYVGAAGWDDSGPEGRFFYATDIRGPYNTLPEPMYRTQDASVGTTSGRSAHIIDANLLITFADMNFTHDSKVSIVRFSNEMNDNAIDLTSDEIDNSNIKLINGTELEGLAAATFTPSNGENVGATFNMVPRGTGYNASIKSQIAMFGTDYTADPLNYESLTLRSGGTRHVVQSTAVGSGTVRPLTFLQGPTINAFSITPTGGVYVGPYTEGVSTDPSATNLRVVGTAKVNTLAFDDGTSQTTSASVKNIFDEGILRLTGGSGINFIGDGVTAIANGVNADVTITGTGTADVLLAGRSGGQTVNGGTAASEDLTLSSNATATKDRIFFGAASAYDELNIRLGVNTTVPASHIHAVSETTSLSRGIISQQSNDTNAQPFMVMRKSKNTAASPTATTSGNILGTLGFQAYVGGTNTWQFGSVISAITTGNASDAAYGPATRMAFFTGSGAAAVTEKLSIASDGVITNANGGGVPFGHMYVNDIAGFTITVSAADTWYEVNNASTPTFTQGQLKNVTFTDHYLTAVTAGYYQVDYSVSLDTTAAGQEVAATVMVNDTANVSAHSHGTVASGAAASEVSGITILNLAANDQVSIAVQNHSAAQNIIIHHAQLRLIYIGSP